MRNQRKIFAFTVSAALTLISFTARTSHAVFADARGNSTCPAFTSAYIDRAQHYLSAVLNSNAFRGCFEQRIAQYRNCDDAASIANVNAVRQAVFRGNNLTLSCEFGWWANNVDGGACKQASAIARVGSPSQANQTFTLCDDWMKGFHQGGYALKPFNWRASDLLHELLHTQGYDHPDTCPSVPGYNGGNTVPYIAGTCVDHIIDHSRCGALDAPSRPGEVRLPSRWDTALNDVPIDPTLCEWVPSLRQRIGIRSVNGKFLRASNGGGGAMDVGAPGRGSWETFHLLDLNGGTLKSGDFVQLRSAAGALLRAASGTLRADQMSSRNHVFKAPIDATDSATFQVFATNGAWGSRINDTTPVALKTSLGTFVTAEGGGGTTLSTNRTTIGAWETFTLPNPRRSWLVNFRSLNQDTVATRYVTFGANGYTDAPLSTINSGPTAVGAFWILDHNGGGLKNGDLVSFESETYPGSFWATCANGTGTVAGGANYVTDCAKFTLEVPGAAAGAPITRNSTVVIRSQQGRYLGAVPSGFATSFTVQNYATAPGPWELFRLETVAPWYID